MNDTVAPTTLECNLRFATDITLESLMTLYMDAFDRVDKQIPDIGGPVLEAKKASKSYSKKQLTIEATKLTKHSDPLVVKFGKAVLSFLSAGALGFTYLMEVILELLLLGTKLLVTCILVIEGVILYAVNILPIQIVLVGLKLVETGLGTIYIKTTDPSVKRYVILSERIKKNAKKDKVTIGKDVIKSSITFESIIAGELDDPTLEIVGNVMENYDTKKSSILTRLYAYDNLAPRYSVLEHVESPLLKFDRKSDAFSSFTLFENIISKPMLSGDGLLHGTLCIVSDYCNKQALLEFLNCYKATVSCELNNSQYKDLPIVTASNIILEYCRRSWQGNQAMLEHIDMVDRVYGEIVAEAYNASILETDAVAVQPGGVSGFRPDPFDIYDLTPFPVAVRRISDTLAMLECAETDEEITEAMIELGRIENIVNECYSVEDMDGYCVISEKSSPISEAKGTKARNAADKTNKKFAKIAVKDKSKSVKTAAKRAITPMEKFIQAQYEKIKAADKEERRNIALKGGAYPKVWRWVKRGIGLLIGSAVGSVIPAAAVITGITFIGFIATDKFLDRRERTKLLQELEDEIEICNEKIDDSRGDDNKQKKYELMRIRNNLKRTQDKIRFGLRY